MIKRLIKLFFSSKKLYFCVRIALGAVFIISGVFKLFDLDSFAKVVDAFALLPSEFCYLFAVGLSVFEIGLGMGIAVKIKGSLWVAILLLLMFIAVLSHAIFMGYDIDCGCFGPDDPERKLFSTLKISLFRDVFFVAQAAYLYAWQNKNNIMV